MLTEYVRGATLGFSATFIDEDGAALTPPGANLRITYKDSGVSTTQIIAMTMVGATATAAWDSSPADAASKTDWFIVTTGSVLAAAQGSFILVANTANPAS